MLHVSKWMLSVDCPRRTLLAHVQADNSHKLDDHLVVAILELAAWLLSSNVSRSMNACMCFRQAGKHMCAVAWTARNRSITQVSDQAWKTDLQPQAARSHVNMWVCDVGLGSTCPDARAASNHACTCVSG